METATLPPIPTVDWSTFLKEFVPQWKRGEHVALIGPTGEGKSWLARELLKARAGARGTHTLVLGTKPRDKTLRRWGWPVIKQWPPDYGQKQVILWPTYGNPATVRRRQRAVFEPILQRVFQDGNRLLYIDEESDFEKRLGMRDLMDEFWTMGRSNGITVMAGTQRPVGVTRNMFAMPHYLFLFGISDDEELKRLGEIGGRADKERVKAEVKKLTKYEFICVFARGTNAGQVIRSKVAQPKRPRRPEVHAKKRLAVVIGV